MAWFNWSQTASSNAGADPTINWAEGQAPSSINDSARAMMAATAKWRDDISGATVTAGSSTAYTLSSFSNFDTLAHLNGQMIAFTPHVTNGATVLLNVDGLGQKPLRSAPGVELLAGTIIAGTPYTAVFNNSDGAFYLQSFYGANPYLIPLGGGMDYWLPTAPNSSFVFPIGQAISRTTYATLFAAMGTTFGTGDGSTTFNLPDKTERVSVMKATSASRLTSSFFGGNSTVLGAVGGAESLTLTLNQIPAGIISSGGVTGSFGSSNGAWVNNNAGLSSSPATGGPNGQLSGTAGFVGQVTGSITGTATVASSNTNGAAHRTVQPTIVCNYIIRII